MELHSAHPYWIVRHGLLTVVPPLGGDLACEVLVVGAGITGALVADRLSEAGVGCAVIDRRDLGQGSTAASTALLQYDIDVPLVELKEKLDPAHATRAYRAGLDAIDSIEGACAGLPDCGFVRRPSLYLTRDPGDTDFLRSELDARAAVGFEVRWLDRADLRSGWGIEAAGAIHSTAGAQVDPYHFTHALLGRCIERGVPVHDRTIVTDIKEHDQSVVVTTDRGVVRARWVVMATGYESVAWLKKNMVNLDSTYALVSEPVSPEALWPDRALLWEHASPYLYARWTDDHRLLLGGRDEGFRNEALRDKLIARKARGLLEDLAELCPGLSIEPAFAWAGTFGSTRDGLGYIGVPPERTRVVFALGFGGNGITYSDTAARVITEMVQGREHPDAAVFGFERSPHAPRVW